ncbi:MAG: YihA family ribosome biogenesis GTP-binding protein [Verrucomicrobia bacterium]|nr:YihA family ribosome biogenesis GTP-binding protein [Verrucomicrobiota bacterium]
MKKNPFTQAQFIASAFEKESFPTLVTPQGKAMPEIAIVGRSNVGKSSLINHLLRNKTLAKTSSKPGKTQSINFFTVDESVVLVDLPGYGYAAVSKALRAGWAEIIDFYLENRSALQMILFLIDSRRTPTGEDCAFVKWATDRRIPLLLIFTKSDKMTESERRKSTLASLETLHPFLHASPIQFLHYSIKDPSSRMELIDKIHTLLRPHGSHP